MNTVQMNYNIKALITGVEMQGAMLRYIEGGAVSDRAYVHGLINTLDERHDQPISADVICMSMDKMREVEAKTSYESRKMKIDLNMLNDQYEWLCKKHHTRTTERVCLTSYLKLIFEESKTEPLKSKRHPDLVYIDVRRIP